MRKTINMTMLAVAPLAAAVHAALLLTACADTERYIAEAEAPQPKSYDEVLALWEAELPSNTLVDAVETIPSDTAMSDYDDYLENQEFKAGRVVTIEWNGDVVSIDNPQVAKGVKVTAQGGYVTVENLETSDDADDARSKVTYLLKGSSAKGQLKVYSQKKFLLRLAGLDLTCPDGPAISIQKKKRCFVQCDEGTVNVLTDGATYASDAVAEPAEDEKGCLFSEGQLIFSGTGALTVNGKHAHGIASDEYIHVHSGCRITVHEAAKDGIHTKFNYRQTGGLVRSYATKDALQSDSLGIRLEGGYLYLYGERPMTADGGGTVTQGSAAQVVKIS